jgi:hypothetical protein
VYGKQFFAALFFGVIFLFSQNIPAQEAGGTEAAVIRELSGTVETRAPGATAWANARAGDRIGKNTLVSTGFKSTAVLVLGDSVITVRPLTRLSLEEIIRNQEGEQVSMYLQAGRIRAEVNPPSGGKTDFTVRSPVATASVRGTTFSFDTENLRVDQGQVQYSLPNGRGAQVGEGGTSYLDETSNTVVSPFAAAAELLSPALPPGSNSGGFTGDTVPAAPLRAGVGIGFGWD